ncbi:MAG: LPS export ABC transporter periplasmic protein LptC [Dysgonamonadaceae bacterium]|nr:LPS export ABC transporter periplasmic protein LptC [Dysgonamonadaceae bacterium]
MTQIRKILSVCVLVAIFTFAVFPQNPQQEPAKVTKILVEHSDSSFIPKEFDFKVQILMGNVVFKHDSAYMYCDSARLNSLDNSLDAYGHIAMNQGDTLIIKSDYLRYNANTKMAELRRNVIMENGEVILKTDSFNYDREINIGFYFSGGMLEDSLNVLTSDYGEYSPDTKMATFIDHTDSVKLENKNKQFVLTTDSLEYNTDTKIAYIVSQTETVSDNGYISSDSGWYNTESEKATLYNRSVVTSKDRAKSITADSMYYDRMNGFTEAFGDMFLNDTVRSAIITGNYGYYDDNTELAFATDSAQLIEYSQGDSLFLHADTLFMRTVDSIREIIAYHGVRFYRTDFQGVCDSMYFNTGDSTLSMYRNPVIWNTGYQIYGDTIHILMNDSTVERMTVKDFAFAVQEVDTAHHNQLKGRIMTAFFRAGELYLLDVKGNAESAYYPIDEKDGSYIGLVKTTGSYITFDIKNRKPVRIKWTDETDMKMLPIPDLTPQDKFLQGYVDLNYLRPKDRSDIFQKAEMKTEDKHEPQKPRSRRAGK